MSTAVLSNSKVSHPGLGDGAFPQLRDPQSRRGINYIPDPTLCEEEFSPSAAADIGRYSNGEETPQVESHFTSALQAGLSESKLLGKSKELFYFRKLHFHYLMAARNLAEAGSCRGQLKQWRNARLHLDEAFQVRSLLVESNLRLVVSIAKKYAAQSPGTLEELISCGNAGLVNAVDQFDYRLGFRFSTYAYTAIQRAIFAELRTEGTHGQRFIEDAFEAARKLTKDASEGTKQIIAAGEAASTVQGVLHNLDERELKIVRARFGFGRNASPQSFREIGDSIGLSKQRVGSIYHAAIAKLRRALHA